MAQFPLTDHGNKGIPLPYLVICITFFYVPERLTYLRTIISNYIGMASKTHIYIVTNTSNHQCIESALTNLPSNISIEFITPSGLGHPYFLTWTHREILQKIVASGEASHFLYTEDDLLLTPSNVSYWMRYREVLQQYGLIPSFFRVEINRNNRWVSTDCPSPIRFTNQPKLFLDDGTLFMNMPNPYQGLYFLDRPLMEELINSPAMSPDFVPDFGLWFIREKAALGLTFVNVPDGYSVRNLVPIDLHGKTVSQEAWVHHLPNNYANDEDNAGGKIPMDNFFALQDNVWIEGGLYSIPYYDNSFAVIKIVKTDLHGVHACIHSKDYTEPPKSIDDSTIRRVEQLDKSLEIEYIPFSRSLFAQLDAQFIRRSEILSVELSKYELWNNAKRGYWVLEE